MVVGILQSTSTKKGDGMQKPISRLFIGGVSLLMIVCLYSCKIEPQIFTVSFITDGGSTVPSQSVIEKGKAIRPAEDPVKTYYTFDNWYTDPTYSTVWDFETPIQKDTTIYARWISYSYTVIFDCQDASDPITVIIHSPEKTVPNLPPSPEILGYVFIGWYTERDGKGTEFTLETELTGDITVYAFWDTNVYSLSFDANGGTGTMRNRYLETDEVITLPPNDFTFIGYTFAGWTTDREGRVMYSDQASYRMPPGDTKLYAKWNITWAELRRMVLDGEDVTKVDTSELTSMYLMCSSVPDFNQDISGWDVSNVTDMSYMFTANSSFNQDISG